MHSKQVTVWCWFWSRGIIGPFFFENEQEDAVTVIGDRALLNEFLLTKIEEESIGNIWFQQDDATCHVAEATLDILSPVFEDRIISRSLAHKTVPQNKFQFLISTCKDGIFIFGKKKPATVIIIALLRPLLKTIPLRQFLISIFCLSTTTLPCN